MIIYRQYIGEDAPEKIKLNTALEVLRDNYRNLNDDQITNLLPTKTLHSVAAVYWSESGEK
jgi:hypothetical protein